MFERLENHLDALDFLTSRLLDASSLELVCASAWMLDEPWPFGGQNLDGVFWRATIDDQLAVLRKRFEPFSLQIILVDKTVASRILAGDALEITSVQDCSILLGTIVFVAFKIGCDLSVGVPHAVLQPLALPSLCTVRLLEMRQGVGGGSASPTRSSVWLTSALMSTSSPV